MSTEDDFDAWLDGMALIAGEPVLDVESSQSEMAIDDVTASPVEQTIESSASRVQEPDQPPAPVDLTAEPRPEIGQVPPPPKAPRRVSQWRDYLWNTLAPIRLARGRQKSSLVINTTCTGNNAEFQAMKWFDLLMDFEWSADPKAISYQFQQSNGPSGLKHHFSCARELGFHGESFCYLHQQKCKPERKMKPAFLVSSGLSCRGFSTVNPHRFSKGAQAHEESDLMVSYIETLKREEPDHGLVENVVGFLLKEAKTSDLTPLQRFLQMVEEALPMYTPRVYLLDSITWLVLNRRRCYIVLTHQRVGGANAARRQAAMMSAVVANRLRSPPLRTGDILLEDSDPVVESMIDKAAKAKPFAAKAQLRAVGMGIV